MSKYVTLFFFLFPQVNSSNIYIYIYFIEQTESPVYVHCKAGKSRSVTAVIAYLIQNRRWQLKKAYDHVMERRNCMCPNIGFVAELMRIEERVFGKANSGGLVGIPNLAPSMPPSPTSATNSPVTVMSSTQLIISRGETL